LATPPLDTEPADRKDVPVADAANAPPSTRREELRSFLFFTVVMAPVLSVLLVSGYGFLVWMYQVVAGPPGG
jgi:periplasmic nitrate reductase NapE